MMTFRPRVRLLLICIVLSLLVQARSLQAQSVQAQSADLAAASTAATTPNGGNVDASPAEVFEQRIMPIFRSPQPASCIQCHLASVDLKDYILPSHEQTFASLRDQGLIDLDAPEKSKILTLIRMGDLDQDESAKRIHEDNRKAEYAAFSAWITACCSDPRLRELPRLAAEEVARPDVPDEVIRHARRNRVIDAFTQNIWSQRMRCFPCHTPHELDENNPKHKLAIQRHKEFMSKLGDGYGERMELFRETPEATLQSMIEKSRQTPSGELPLINLQNPADSLLLLKPTAKLPSRNSAGEFDAPSYVQPVSHMGGLKIHVNDVSYKAFVSWIQDYSRVVNGTYKSVEDLPQDAWTASNSVLVIQSLPKHWATASCLQVFVHAWNDQTNDYSPHPVAFTQSLVGPRGNAVGSLMLLDRPATADTTHAAAGLPPGKYLLKVFRDSQQRLESDPTAFLTDSDFVGQIEVNAKWREGFPEAEKVSGQHLK